MRHAQLFAALFLAIPVAIFAAGPEAYPIRLDRPSELGAKYVISAAGTVKQTGVLFSNGRELPLPDDTDYELTLQFKGDARIDAVDTRGRPTRITYHVAQCVLSAPTAKGKSEKIVAEPGSILVAKLVDQDTTFEIAGKELDSQSLTALKATLAIPAGKSDEETFGSTDPRKPGESWPISATRAAAGFTERGLNVAAANIQGTTTFAEIVTRQNIPCASIRIDMTARGLKPAPGAEPPGFKTDGGAIAAQMSALYPLDTALPRLTESRSMTMDTYMTRPGTPGKDATHIRIRQQRSMNLERTLVK